MNVSRLREDVVEFSVIILQPSPGLIRLQVFFKNLSLIKEVVKMPRGDRTGPEGMGSMTGRAAGYCAGYSMPGYANPIVGRGGFGYGRGFGSGRGLGRGRGFGRGIGRGFGLRGAAYPYAYANPYYAAPYAPEVTPKEEADTLKSQAKVIQQELDTINSRIKELESSENKDK